MNYNELKNLYFSHRVEIFAKYPGITTLHLPVEHHKAVEKWLLQSIKDIQAEAESYAEKNLNN